ncbi:hypothetical protein [Motiliproteus sediminis]|uniref:hypothetical protein n=1 Tax=Motiliproteus sediminis TaxID=1468178 RepID=UPI001AEF5BD3|nr:hypothetical protein [Motiliproteus sediminis]
MTTPRLTRSLLTTLLVLLLSLMLPVSGAVAGIDANLYQQQLDGDAKPAGNDADGEEKSPLLAASPLLPVARSTNRSAAAQPEPYSDCSDTCLFIRAPPHLRL